MRGERRCLHQSHLCDSGFKCARVSAFVRACMCVSPLKGDPISEARDNCHLQASLTLTVVLRFSPSCVRGCARACGHAYAQV